MGRDIQDLTIRADIVAAGVGLPPVYALHGVRLPLRWVTNGAHDPEWQVDASDPQTAFGLALMLDEWERAGGRSARWAADLALALQEDGQPSVARALLTAMLARIERIGRGCTHVAGRITDVPALAGITDPLEALRAIYKELTS